MVEHSGESTRITQLDGWGSVQLPGHPCLVIIYGARLGQRFLLPQGTMLVVGRERDSDIALVEDAVSRKHAEISSTEQGVQLLDLDSTNGTYINGKPVSQVRLTQGDLVKIGGTIFKFLDSGNVESAYFEEIYRMTIMDGLTEIHNRRYLLETMERELPRARRHGRPLSLILFDLDHFKQVNDNFGHLTGDHVLREMAAIIRQRVRREEVFARYGGEEFVILLPETLLEPARHYAEQLRKLVERHTFLFEGRELAMTISLGVAELIAGMSTPQELIQAADQMLYQAKSRGRNRVVA
ncbi:MAG: GGDEF domain-containing protein [Deltaproteobacteria bacterium]|nr:GGDEF domain-containing protein [Deltaproteobacteria bacterium]